jgi:membrane protein
MKGVLFLFVDSYNKWLLDRAMRKGAALAYYTLFSLAPLLVIMAGIVAALLGEELESALQSSEFIDTVAGVVGAETADLLLEIVQGAATNATDTSSATIATLISLGILLWGASNIFNYLHETLNTIWGVGPVPKGSTLAAIRHRLIAFLFIAISGILIIFYLVVNTMLAILIPIISRLIPDVIEIIPYWQTLQILQYLALLVVATLLFTAIYKILPDVEVTYRDTLIGAVVTAILFAIGTFALGIYFSFSNLTSIYGVAGSIMIILLWFYYSAQIFLYGAEFTFVYADRYGSKISPADDAYIYDSSQYETQGITDEVEDMPGREKPPTKDDIEELPESTEPTAK